MKTIMMVCISVCFSVCTHSQTVKFTKKTLSVDEPYDKGSKKETFTIELTAENIPAGGVGNVTIQASTTESTYPSTKAVVTTAIINPLAAKNSIKLDVTTDEWDDKDKYVILTATWVVGGENKQAKDTLFVKNTYPFKSTVEKDYRDWNDPKTAEIFIGTNFDFIDSKVTLSDWYGGARVFLPSITNLGYNRDDKKNPPRLGFAAGIYHAKSLSNFGNPQIDNDPIAMLGRVINYFGDSATVRFDSTKIKTKVQFNNWGVYVSPLYQMSRFVSSDSKFVTNIYLGSHFEVIRRNITTNYTLDTVGTRLQNYRANQIPRAVSLGIPTDFIQTYYDSYFGISVPIQFLWKDILDIKINPCMGFGSRGYSSREISRSQSKVTKVPGFYLVQFDLLARLGGLRLNIGGEVRGYFPNQNPIITSYLGTSFSVQKLVDFVTK